MHFVESSGRVSALRVLNMHHQASPVSRTPSMPSVDTSYIPPVPPLIQDYRPYYHTPNDLSGNDETRHFDQYCAATFSIQMIQELAQRALMMSCVLARLCCMGVSKRHFPSDFSHFFLTACL